jgi:hypothetical protein
MEESKQIHALLVEIRDLQQEHLAEYRKQAARSVALAEEAVTRQRSGLVLYKRALIAVAILLLPLVVSIVWSMLA